MANVRNAIRKWVDAAFMAALGVGVVPKQWAALVDVTSNDQNQVRLPAAARARRFVGLLDVGQVPATVGPANGDPIDVLKHGRGCVNLPAGASCAPGDLGVIADTSGNVTPYIPGTGGAETLGVFKTKYTNGQSDSVPVEFELRPQQVYEVTEIQGYVRTVAANNTRYIGMDATELSAAEPVFTAPRDGVLQGPFRIDLTQGVGPAGAITAKVYIKPPNGSWAAAQVGATPADWTTTLADASAAATADDVTVNLPYGNSIAITKGTRVAFQLVKDNAVANVSQLSARVSFWS